MTKRRFIAGAAIAFAIAGPAAGAFADSGTGNPTGTHTNPSGCLGAERATRNSNGGDRAQGGFGPAQSAYVQSLQGSDQNYGEALHAWEASNC